MTLELLELDRPEIGPDTEARPRAPERIGVVDCDVHPTVKSLADFEPFLESRWRQHLL